MTVEAAGSQNGADLRLKELLLLGRKRSTRFPGAAPGRDNHNQKQPNHADAHALETCQAGGRSAGDATVGATGI